MSDHDSDDLRSAVNNPAAFWTALAEIRGHDHVRHPGYLVMDGDDKAGRRVLTLTADLGPSDVADITALTRDRSRIVVEDAFDVLDLTEQGKTRRYLPVMIRRSPDMPAPVPGVDITPVTTVEQLAIAERIVAEGFDLPAYLPWSASEAFPADVLKRDDIDMFTASYGPAWLGAVQKKYDTTA